MHVSKKKSKPVNQNQKKKKITRKQANKGSMLTEEDETKKK
jgi:hypothetical protein